MILQERRETTSLGHDEVLKMNIDTSNEEVQEVVLRALISQYQNPLASTIRELASNIKDATTEKQRIIRIVEGNATESDIQAQDTSEDIYEIYKHLDRNSRPFIKYEEGGLNETAYLIFKDYGRGMGYKFIANTYVNIGVSTKRNNNNEIGGWGVGSKAVLGYTDSYMIISVHNGIEQVFEVVNDKPLPKINVYTGVPTNEKNSTTIKIPIKSSDTQYKIEGIFDKYLSYLKGIDFVNIDCEVLIPDLDNEDFAICLNSTSNTFRVSVGGVLYPMSWEDVHRTEIYAPVVLKFGIGELSFPVHRDNLIYDEETILKVQKKLDTVINVCNQEVTKTTNNLDEGDLFKALRIQYAVQLGARGINNRNIKPKDVAQVYALLANSNYSSTFKYKNLKFQSTDKLPISITVKEVTSVFNKKAIGGKVIVRDELKNYGELIKAVSNQSKFYVKTCRASTSVDFYALSLNNGASFYTIDFNEVMEDKDTDIVTYIKGIGLEMYDEINIPEEFSINDTDIKNAGEIVSKEKARRLEGKVLLHLLRANTYAYYIDDCFSYESKDFKITDIEKEMRIPIYGYKEDKHLLEGVMNLVDTNKYLVCMIAKNQSLGLRDGRTKESLLNVNGSYVKDFIASKPQVIVDFYTLWKYSEEVRHLDSIRGVEILNKLGYNVKGLLAKLDESNVGLNRSINTLVCSRLYGHISDMLGNITNSEVEAEIKRHLLLLEKAPLLKYIPSGINDQEVIDYLMVLNLISSEVTVEGVVNYFIAEELLSTSNGNYISNKDFVRINTKPVHIADVIDTSTLSDIEIEEELAF